MLVLNISNKVKAIAVPSQGGEHNEQIRRNRGQSSPEILRENSPDTVVISEDLCPSDGRKVSLQNNTCTDSDEDQYIENQSEQESEENSNIGQNSLAFLIGKIGLSIPSLPFTSHPKCC